MAFRLLGGWLRNALQNGNIGKCFRQNQDSFRSGRYRCQVLLVL